MRFIDSFELFKMFGNTFTRYRRYARCARPATPESDGNFWSGNPGRRSPARFARGYYLSPLRGFKMPLSRRMICVTLDL